MSNLFQEETSQKGHTITIVVFICLIGFLGLASTVVPLPQRDSVDKSLDLIMLEAIAMASAEEAEEEKAVETPVEEEVSEPEISPENIDEILSAFTAMSPVEVTNEAPTLPERGESESMKLGSDMLLEFRGQKDLGLFGDSQGNNLDTDLVSRNRGEAWTLKPNIVSGSISVSNTQLSSGAGVSGADLVTRSGQPKRLVQTIFEEWGEEEGVSMTAEEILRENAVIRWMQARLKALDRPVRTVFQQNASDLTVNEPVIIGSTTYNLQMMYSPVSRTLHIAWIDEEIIYYFVDPALQYQINYFEEGVVERGLQMEIVLIETEELSARSPQAVREYEIFLNWWKPQIESSTDG